MKQLQIDFNQTCNSLKEKGLPEELIKHFDLWFLQHNMSILNTNIPHLETKFRGSAGQLLSDFNTLDKQHKMLLEKKESLHDWEAINNSR